MPTYRLFTDFQAVYYEINGFYYDEHLELIRAPSNEMTLLMIIDPTSIVNFTSEPFFISDGENATLLVTEGTSRLNDIASTDPGDVIDMNIVFLRRSSVPDPALPYQDGQQTLMPLAVPSFNWAVYVELQDPDLSRIEDSNFLIYLLTGSRYIELVRQIDRTRRTMPMGSNSDGDPNIYYVVNKSEFYNLDLTRIPDETILTRAGTETTYEAYLNIFDSIWQISEIDVPATLYVITPQNDALIAYIGNGYESLYGRVLPNNYFYFKLIHSVDPETMQFVVLNPSHPINNLYGQLLAFQQGSSVGINPLLSIFPSQAAEIGQVTVASQRSPSPRRSRSLSPIRRGPDLHKQSFEEHLRHLYQLSEVGPPFKLTSFEEAGKLLQSGQVTSWSIPPMLQPWAGLPGTPNRILELQTQLEPIRVRAQVIGNQIYGPI